MVLTGWVDQNDTSAVLAKGEAIWQVKRALLLADVALPDSSQTVIVKRADTTRPIPPKTAAVTTVTTEADTTLSVLSKQSATKPALMTCSVKMLKRNSAFYDFRA